MSLENEIDLSKNNFKNQEENTENIIMQILVKSGFVLTKDIS